MSLYSPENTPTRPTTLLIAALGGEGGGVLTGWIVATAEAMGLPVQATSIPGVAQRTGATTYYIEIWPQPVLGRRPVLSLSPAPGEVDIFATTELLEAGRAVHAGLVTPDRTVVVGSTHRVYTTAEKMAVGDGRFDHDALVRAVRRQGRSAHLFDMAAVAAASKTHISAVVLGALAGADVLPIPARAYEDAIREGGKAVDANLAGFAAGRAAVATPVAGDAVTQPSLESLIDLAQARATAFQGAAYGETLIRRLTPFRAGDPALATAVVKGLARRMVYNDIIQVATMKLRTGRMADARVIVNAGGDDVVRVRDYFRPGLAEIADILPAVLGRALLKWGRRRVGWRLTLTTTSVMGYLALRLLAALRPMRPASLRFKAEQAAVEAWLADIAAAKAKDPALALAIARNARLIKGYGDTHARSLEVYEAIRTDHVAPALAGTGGGAAEVEAARSKALNKKD